MTSKTPKSVSPKVTSSAGGSALGVVLAWLFSQLPLVSDAPAAVQAALVVVVIGAVTFAAGWLKRDPARG